MSESKEEQVKIRPLQATDFDALVHLDSILIGSEKRREYWEKKFAVFRLRHPNLSLVAIRGSHLIGYVMGNISGWEFGVSAGIGWIELIGTHPDEQRKGIARELTEELLHQFKTLGVEMVYTMVVAKDTSLRHLFKSLGFEEGHMVQLEKKLS